VELISVLKSVAAGLTSANGTITHIPAVAASAEQRERSAGSGVLDVQPHEAPSSTPPPLDSEDQVLDLRVAWTVKSGDEIRGSASIAGGSVHAGSYDGKLYSVDESDGAVRWK